MAYVTPGTVAAGDVATAAAWNVITNDVIDHESRINDVALYHIATNTFSAASSTSFVSLLTSTYANYRVICQFTSVSGAAGIAYMKLRSGATDISANYSYGGWLVEASGTANISQATGGVNGFYVSTIYSGYAGAAASFDLIGPQLASNTEFMNIGGSNYSNTRLEIYGGLHSGATAYDGITIYASVGTLTGTARLYGYQNS